MIIKKYELSCICGQIEEITIHSTDILRIEQINGRIYLWVLIDPPTKTKYLVKLLTVGCNTEFKTEGIMKYMGTIIINGFDRHIFLESLVKEQA